MNAWLTILAIGGGTDGVVSCLAQLIRSLGSSLKEFVAIALILAVYCVGILGGIKDNAESTKKRQFIEVYLAMQIPVLNTSWFSYKVFALISYAAIVHPAAESLEFQWFVGADWELALFHGVAEVGVGINVIPALVLIWLRKFSALSVQPRT